MAAALEASGAGVVASFVMAGGVLTGKYDAGETGRAAGELDDPRFAAARERGQPPARARRRSSARARPRSRSRSRSPTRPSPPCCSARPRRRRSPRTSTALDVDPGDRRSGSWRSERVDLLEGSRRRRPGARRRAAARAARPRRRAAAADPCSGATARARRSRSDAGTRFLPGFASAAAAARRRGFTPVIRGAGGRAAAYDEGCLVFDEIMPAADSMAGIQARFAARPSARRDALRGARRRRPRRRGARRVLPGRVHRQRARADAS